MGSLHSVFPFISVVIPLYNKQEFIANTLHSVLMQEYANYEIIVVDDGSTDKSVEVVKGIEDNRIRIVQRPNGGDGAARNTGIREAKGELVAFLDGDDEWMPEFLPEIARMSQVYPAAGMYAPGIRLKHRKGYAVDIFVESANKEQIFKIENFFDLSLQRSFITSSNVAIRKEVFDQVGCFYEEIGVSSDRDMWARVAMSYDVICSRKVLAVYKCDYSSGRVSKSKMKEFKPPAIHHTVSNMIRSRGRAAIDQSIIDFLHLNWFGRIEKSVRAGNLGEAKRIIRTEIVDPKRYRWRYWWTLIVVHAFPVAVVQLLFRLQRSRWINVSGFSNHNGSFPRVVQRKCAA